LTILCKKYILKLLGGLGPPGAPLLPGGLELPGFS